MKIIIHEVITRCSGGKWPRKRKKTPKPLFLDFSGWSDIQNLNRHTSAHQPEGEHYTRHKVTRQMLTKTPRRSGRASIASTWLSSKFVREGKKSVFCFHTAPRDVFVNVTLVKLFATVSPVDATSSLEQRKSAGANDKITRWYLFYSFNW